MLQVSKSQVAATTRDLSALSDSIEYWHPTYCYHPVWRFVPTKSADWSDKSTWSFSKIGAPRAWDRTKGDRKIIAAVLEGGFDDSHPELSGRLWENTREVPGNKIDDDKNGIVDDYYGVSFIGSPPSGDLRGPEGKEHGTHVAGILAASHDNRLIDGMADEMRLMALDFSGSSADFADAMIYATTHGVSVVNFSWGGCCSDPTAYDAISVAGKGGVLLVAAGPDEKFNMDSRWVRQHAGDALYPALFTLDNIIVVMATGRSDEILYGYGEDSVDLAAPGANIGSIGLDHNLLYEMPGTSVAAPHVTGAIVLIEALAPNWQSLEVKQYLMEAVDQLGPEGGSSGQRKSVTNGRLNVGKAVSSIEFLQPHVGNRWKAGQPAAVIWQGFKTEVCTEMEITLSIDGGKAFRVIPGVPLVHRISGSQVLVVPPWLTNSARISMMCAGTRIGAVSDLFTIEP